MHTLFERQIFCRGQSDFRCDQSFYHRIVCQVQEHDDVVGYAAFLKGTAEKFCHIVFDAHGGEHDREFFIAVAAEGSLLYDLCGKLVMGQAVS